MGKKNLSKIAKSAISEPKKTTNTIDSRKVTENKSLIITSSDESERDKIAKETVANLLSEVKIPQISEIIEKKEEVSNPQDTDENSIDPEKLWLEEQIDILNRKNEELINRLEQIETNQNVGFNDSYDVNIDNNDVIKNTITLYVKIQNIYDSFIRSGGKLIIEPKQFLIELESFFPYLAQYRRRLLDE